MFFLLFLFVLVLVGRLYLPRFFLLSLLFFLIIIPSTRWEGKCSPDVERVVGQAAG